MPIVTIFHIEPPGVEENKMFPNEPGHMINMADMPVYDKIFLKIFFSRTYKLMALKLGICH